MIAILALLGGPASADDVMSASEFDAYTRGKTLFYGRSGAPYGAEVYLDNHRVRWSFLDGECKDGTWYEEAGLICFVYEDHPDPQCWSFSEAGNGLVARFENSESSEELYEARDVDEDMICLGPKVGV
ncbi:hypothetical protein AB1M95_05560 [Sulfitobacter sp. LCG007]